MCFCLILLVCVCFACCGLLFGCVLLPLFFSRMAGYCLFGVCLFSFAALLFSLWLFAYVLHIVLLVFWLFVAVVAFCVFVFVVCSEFMCVPCLLVFA